jgi:hypothetical protein
VIGERHVLDTPAGPSLINTEEKPPGARRVHEVLMLGPKGFTPRLYSDRCPASYPYWEPCENWDAKDPEKRCRNPKGPWRKPRSWAGVRKEKLRRCRHCYLRQGNESSAEFLSRYNKLKHGTVSFHSTRPKNRRDACQEPGSEAGESPTSMAAVSGAENSSV